VTNSDEKKSRQWRGDNDDNDDRGGGNDKR